jgi:aryl-alcohol dehydrogenase-like predicted oxidoreductase
MADEATSRRILDQAVDAGVDFLDVAEVYPVPPDPKWAGASEQIVGRWLAGRPRDAVFIATKIAGPGGGWFPGVLRPHLARPPLYRALGSGYPEA